VTAAGVVDGAAGRRARLRAGPGEVTMAVMNRLGLFAAGALVCLLPSCMTIAQPERSEVERSGTAYGAFLAAQHAGRVSDRSASTDFYRTALDATPEESYLVESAFMAALQTGDLDEAARLGEALIDSPTTDRLARVLLASRAVKDRRYRRAVELLEDKELGPFNRVIGSLVLAWAYSGLGEPDKALEVLNAPGDAPILGHLMTLHRALVLERAGRQAEADEAYREAFDTGLMRPLVVEAYGRRLERAGREDEASRLYTEHLTQYPGDAAARIGLERIAEGRMPSAFAATPAQGASMAVFGPAWTLAENAPSNLAVVYLRLALYLDPNNGIARQLLGDMLADRRLDADALEVYSEADAVSPFYVSSKIAEADSLLRLGRPDEALSTLEALVAETGAPRARLALGEAHHSLEHYEEALAIYDTLIKEAEASGAQVEWGLYYVRGVAHERTGRWDLAEADFRRALEIVPNEADVLNYLGYTWVDRGENLEQAFDMIRRAVSLEPDSGYIVDSLGWAHFKRGEYEIAVRHLERAVELDPQDPTINEHLGDAYWRVGRLLEASYQWRRSLTLNPTEDVRVALEEKLADGLPSLADEPLLASP
jgi:tetratricopeptide (TPR) repeat protein